VGYLAGGSLTVRDGRISIKIQVNLMSIEQFIISVFSDD